MTDIEREHLLHKVVAGSAFLFALCILPVAQYFLVSSQLPSGSVAASASPEDGQVAGVSTERTQADILPDATPSATAYATKAECLGAKQKELDDLKRFEDGKKIALLRDYDQKVAQFKEAQSKLTGSAAEIKSESDALQSLIDPEYQAYTTKLSQVQEAVDSQKNSIESRPCPE